jgi:hypothetical protein
VYNGTKKKLMILATIELSPYIAVCPASCFNGFKQVHRLIGAKIRK